MPRSPKSAVLPPKSTLTIHTLRKLTHDLVSPDPLPRNFVPLFDSVTISALERVNLGENPSFAIHKTAIYLRGKLLEDEFDLDRQAEIDRCLRAQASYDPSGGADGRQDF